MFPGSTLSGPVQDKPSGRKRLSVVVPASAAAVVAVLALLVVVWPKSKAPVPTPTPVSAVSAPTPTGTPLLSGFARYAATVKGPAIDVYASPSRTSKVVVHLGHVDENRVPQTFLIEREEDLGNSEHWFNVLLPIKPNGSKGWISASDVTTTEPSYLLVIHLNSFKLDLMQDGRK